MTGLAERVAELSAWVDRLCREWATVSGEPSTPKARPGPGGEREPILAGHYAPLVTDALSCGLSAASIAADWAASRPTLDRHSTAMTSGSHIRTWVAAHVHLWVVGHVHPDPADLASVLADIHRDAFLAGAKGALDVLPARPLTAAAPAPAQPSKTAPIAAAVAAVNWPAWAPGAPDLGEATDGLDEEGSPLGDLLAGEDDAAAGIADTTVGRLSTVLADALTGGASDDLAGALGSILSDAARGMMVASTETNTAMTAGTLGAAAEAGITSWNVIAASDACDICQAMVDGNPYSDDGDGPPYHVNCRCGLSPAGSPDDVVSTGQGTSDSVDDGSGDASMGDDGGADE